MDKGKGLKTKIFSIFSLLFPNSYLLTPKKLAVQFHGTSLSLLLFDRQGVLKYESILLHESLDDTLAAKIRMFLGEAHPQQTLLILPRSEVLQKEMLFPKAGTHKESLETKLRELLPYSPHEMAYGIAINSEENVPSKGLLYAIPERKLSETLDFLARLGISVDEIVSEDQCLYWLHQGKAEGKPLALSPSGTAVLMDQTSERLLFVVVTAKGTLSSRVYTSETGELKNVLSEIALSFLETGSKPAKAVAAGFGSEERSEIMRSLAIPVEYFEPESFLGQPVPAPLSGARFWGKFSVISLLPSAMKSEKSKRNRKRLIRESILAFFLFLGSLTFLGAAHLFFLGQKAKGLENELANLTPQVAEVREIARSLHQIEDARNSKERLLTFIKDMAEHVPTSIRLKEFQAAGTDIVFQGESPSHMLLSETVQAFEKSRGVGEVKLEHTRLRKRLNQDYFEFEVAAKWR